jgi:hypothetical protein
VEIHDFNPFRRPKMLRLGKAVQVLSLVVFCTVCFGTIARAAEREAPRGKAPKAEAPREAAKQRVELHRAGKTVGKWTAMKTMTATSGGDNDCSVSCNDAICVCYYDWWDESCCDFGCNYCWLLMG